MFKSVFSRNQYKYRKFDYQPMYYDERKEKLNLKIKQNELKDTDDSPEAMKVRRDALRSQISSSWNTNNSKKTTFFQANYKSIVFVGALILAIYIILFKLNIEGFLEKYI